VFSILTVNAGRFTERPVGSGRPLNGAVGYCSNVVVVVGAWSASSWSYESEGRPVPRSREHNDDDDHGSVFRILQTYLTMLTVLCQSFVEK